MPRPAACWPGDEKRTQRETLIDLLETSISEGHRWIAIRRFFMLETCGLRVPRQLRHFTEHAISRSDARTLARIYNQMDEWAAMINVPTPARARVRDRYIEPTRLT